MGSAPSAGWELKFDLLGPVQARKLLSLVSNDSASMPLNLGCS